MLRDRLVTVSMPWNPRPISQLQNFPPDSDVEFYAGKGGVGLRVQQVCFHPGGFEALPLVVLIDEPG
jgi:hypothetical protein